MWPWFLLRPDCCPLHPLGLGPVADDQQRELLIAADDLLRIEWAAGAVPSRHRGAHRHERAARLLRHLHRENRFPHAVEHRVAEDLALAVPLADDLGSRRLLEAPKLGVADEALALRVDVEADVRRHRGFEARPRIVA